MTCNLAEKSASKLQSMNYKIIQYSFMPSQCTVVLMEAYKWLIYTQYQWNF